MACVGNDNDLREVTLGPMAPSPEWARARSSSITPPPPRKLHASFTRPPRKGGFDFIEPRCPAVRPVRKTAPLP